MAHTLHYWTCPLSILLLLSTLQISQANERSENGMKISEFKSPKISLEPGSVSNKYYYDVDFPLGHIAIKSFNAEVIDENNNPIPLHETYLHHWIMVRYYQRIGIDIPKYQTESNFLKSGHIIIKNSGLCDYGLSQYFGLGSETRRTSTYVPDPYGIEVGNSADIPEGYEEKWLLNVHAIDTRGADDKLGCTECRCDLYNVTVDEYGLVVPKTYKGGLRCCYDEARCKLKDGFRGVKKNLYLRYIVKYVDWESSILPVKIYIFDVTDIWTRADEPKGVVSKHRCSIEYDVDSCPDGVGNDGCTHTKSLTVGMPSGGDVIYGVGHQHAGGVGTALYGEGGRVICSSYPTYGNGDEPGNEAGYIVGMSTCYPNPGSVKITAGEMLTFVSNYSSEKTHTGLMGLFYILVADLSEKSNITLHASDEVHKTMVLSNYGWAMAALGVSLVALVVLMFGGRSRREEGYEALSV